MGEEMAEGDLAGFFCGVAADDEGGEEVAEAGVEVEVAALVEEHGGGGGDGDFGDGGDIVDGGGEDGVGIGRVGEVAECVEEDDVAVDEEAEGATGEGTVVDGLAQKGVGGGETVWGGDCVSGGVRGHGTLLSGMVARIRAVRDDVGHESFCGIEGMGAIVEGNWGVYRYIYPLQSKEGWFGMRGARIWVMAVGMVMAGMAGAQEPAATQAGQDGVAAGSEAVPVVPEKKLYTVPAGTKVLLQLKSAVNTASAKPGDGVYLASTFPVTNGSRVLIPAGVYVQGVVDSVVRPGRIHGRAQLNMHFTSIIFPNGTVVEIPGLVNSLPGAKQQDVKGNGEGTIEQAGNKGRNAGKVAEIGVPTGATIGSIGGLGSGHPIAGGVIGAVGGLAAAGVVALLTRGQEVNIEAGTQVEMVLQRPLVLEEGNLAAGVADGAVAPGLVPAANQPKPMGKPAGGRPRILCPAGGLGCPN